MNLLNRRINNIKIAKRDPSFVKRSIVTGIGMAQARKEFAHVNSFSFVITMKRKLRIYNNPELERDFFNEDYNRVGHQVSKNLQLMEHNVFWKYKQRPIKRISFTRSV